MKVVRDILVIAIAVGLLGCDNAPAKHVAVPDKPDAIKTAARVRAERRAFDGAPPVIPHTRFNSSCIECHNEQGKSVPEHGFAPPSPHELTKGMSAMSRCTQCHVFAQDDTLFVSSHFEGLRQNLRKGKRLNELAPPVIPHMLQMRENCLACHSGPAAREEIRTTHPQRARCIQCHVPSKTNMIFGRINDAGLGGS